MTTCNTIEFNNKFSLIVFFGFPGGSDNKERICLQSGRPGSIPGLGRPPGGGHGKPLQNSCLENPMDRGAWQAVIHGITKSRTPLNMTKHNSVRGQMATKLHKVYIRLIQIQSQDTKRRLKKG